MKPKYYLKDDEFVIEDYNLAKPFSSFLPGIAGLYGKPLWVFYVNRGQCIASFGMNSKDGAIMEFYPANSACRRVTLEGFRTFIKYRSEDGKNHIYEPFSIPLTGRHQPKQIMYVSPHELRIEEISEEHGFKCEAVSYMIPGEDFPALARILRIENLISGTRHLEIVDGMPKIMPYGLNEWFMKHMSYTIEAWMEVQGVSAATPFYHLRVDAADVAETKFITSGNFYLGRSENKTRPVIIVDPRIVFGRSIDFTYPDGFASGDFLPALRQTDRNITPSALAYYKFSTTGRKPVMIFGMSGYTVSAGQLAKIDSKISAPFFMEKRALNRSEISRIASTISVFSGMKELDSYVGQTNLDNILRGGLPINIPGDTRTIYVFNRKHGDLERDYNNFVVQAENFAQGNGNFRDMNQNRRLSVWLNPSVLNKDIKDFYDLIQLDGYNPLIIKGEHFTIRNTSARKKIAARHFGRDKVKSVQEFLAGRWTIGELMNLYGDRNAAQKNRLIIDVFKYASGGIEAEHGEGFWVDHWTYNLDLVESYLSLYPEKKLDLLFGEKIYRFFDNDHVVTPHKFHPVTVDAEKKALIASRKMDANWVRTKYGKGDIYRTTLAAKMLIIAANKIATLDRTGIGIEMEAGKPGWCDSMNGLPGLRGSSSSEMFELARLIRFLVAAVNEAGNVNVAIPAEAAMFLRGLAVVLKAEKSASYKAKSEEIKQEYRKITRLGISGKEVIFGKGEILEFLLASARKVEHSIEMVNNPEGLPYTYFADSRPLPLFLEGVVHALKIQGDSKKAKAIYERVKKSPLYDEVLGMYKLNAPLDAEPLEIGRSRAFTPGWLENETVWLHMEYKYLLEILRCGLYDEFFSDLKKAIIPFQDPQRYGRSILENSSFIVSSRFFDQDLIGNGFYARLSGATAEFLHMLHIMNLGPTPFVMDGPHLFFKPAPILKKEFFNSTARDIYFEFKKGIRKVKLPPRSYSFNIFAKTLLTYENPRMRDTFSKDRIWPAAYHIRYSSGKERSVDARALPEPFSKDLRSGLIDHITITLE